MPTRAEAFRADEQRRRRPPKPKTKHLKRKQTDKLEEVKESIRREGDRGTGLRNLLKNEQNITVAYETSDTDRPSRKSTRASGGRKKGASALERRRQFEATRPASRAMRKKRKTRRAKTRPA